MDYGDCAINAVGYAKTRDIYTGGVVNVYKLDELNDSQENEVDNYGLVK